MNISQIDRVAIQVALMSGYMVGIAGIGHSIDASATDAKHLRRRSV